MSLYIHFTWFLNFIQTKLSIVYLFIIGFLHSILWFWNLFIFAICRDICFLHVCMVSYAIYIQYCVYSFSSLDVQIVSISWLLSKMMLWMFLFMFWRMCLHFCLLYTWMCGSQNSMMMLSDPCLLHNLLPLGVDGTCGHNEISLSWLC